MRNSERAEKYKDMGCRCRAIASEYPACAIKYQESERMFHRLVNEHETNPIRDLIAKHAQATREYADDAQDACINYRRLVGDLAIDVMAHMRQLDGVLRHVRVVPEVLEVLPITSFAGLFHELAMIEELAEKFEKHFSNLSKKKKMATPE